MRVRERHRAVGASVMLAVLLVACSSSAKTKTAPDTAEQIRADQAIAQKAVLKLDDLPAGYKATPHTEDSDDDAPKAVVNKFAACMKLSESEAEEFLNGGDDPTAPSVDSADFDLQNKLSGYSTKFRNSVTIERSSKDISEPLETLGKKDGLPCWKDVIRAALTLGLQPGDSVTGLKVAALDTGDVGDSAVAFAVRANFKTKGLTVPVFVNLYFVGSGRAGVYLFASRVGDPVDKDLALSLLTRVTERLEATS